MRSKALAAFLFSLAFIGTASSASYSVDGIDVEITWNGTDGAVYERGTTLTWQINATGGNIIEAGIQKSETQKAPAIDDIVNNQGNDSYMEYSHTFEKLKSGLMPVYEGLAIDVTLNNSQTTQMGSYNFELKEAADTTSPSLTIHNPTNTTYSSSSVDLNVTANEAVSTWEYSLDAGSNQTFTPNTTLTGLSDGSHQLDVYAMDDSGNNGSESVSFTVDTTDSNTSDGSDNTTDSNTTDSTITEVYNRTGIEYNDSYTTDPFTADSLENFTVDANFSDNTSVNATLKAYNDTEMTSSQEFEILEGSNTYNVTSFSDSADTYLIEFKTLNGSVNSLNLTVRGNASTTSPSPAAPATGGFFQGGMPVVQGVIDTVAVIPDFVSNLVNSIMEALPIP